MKKKEKSKIVVCPNCGGRIPRKAIPSEKKITITCPKCNAMGFFRCSEVEEKDDDMSEAKIGLFESSLILNIIFSVPGGTGLITLGAFLTDSLIFYGGVILLLQGFIVFPLLIVLPSYFRNLTLIKLSRLKD